MKQFVYTAKDASGALRRGGLDAADRTVALASLKAQGLTPVSLKEGSAPRETGRSRRPSVPTVLIVAAGCAMFATVLLKPWSKEAAGSAAGVEKEKLEKPQTVRRAEMPGIPEMPVAANIAEEASEKTGDVVPPAVAAETKPLSSIQPPKPTGATRVLTPGAVNTSTNRPRPAFTTGTEQVISWIANSRLGDPPPILPMLPIGEDVGKILDTDIVLYEDDDERVEAIKTNVAKMKQAMKEFVAEGGAPHEFLQFYQSELKAAHEEWRVSQAEFMKKIREGDREEAAAFLDERNKELAGKGIKPLTVPPFLKQKIQVR